MDTPFNSLWSIWDELMSCYMDVSAGLFVECRTD